MTLTEKMEVIQKLQQIVDEHVNFWKEDFLEDQKYILRKSNNYPMLFLARECGTVLVSFADAENWSVSAINDICHGAMETIIHYLHTQPDEVKVYTITGTKVSEIKKERLMRSLNLIDQVQAKLLANKDIA